MARVVVLPGDGVGPEVTREAVRVLEAAGQLWGVAVRIEEHAVGGAAIDRFGDPLPRETLAACQGADAVLLGAVGGPAWDGRAGPRPEAGLLRLRQELGVYANLRPVVAMPWLAASSPLRPEVFQHVRYTIVRELTGGLYFGPRGRKGDRVTDTLVYTRREIARVTRVAFSLAAEAGTHVTLVDKANVLESSRVWREVVGEVASEYPYVPFDTELVDACAMRLCQDPGRYGVILTENLFGDILSDLGAGTLGSLGLMPSASLGDRSPGLYEPVHGSAPDIAGKGVANPLGAIGAVAMMFRYGLGHPEAADAIDSAVADAIEGGARTPDIVVAGERAISTREMGDRVLRSLAAVARARDTRLTDAPSRNALDFLEEMP
jgi:3-isopropylmalate dehydrogenase